MNTILKRMMLPLLILSLVLPSFGQGGPAKGAGKAGQGKMIQELNLTEAQEDQMQDLRFAHEKVMIDLRADMKKAQLDLRQLKMADEPSKKKIYAQIDKVGEARIAMEKAKADHQLEVRKVLTDEQYKIFKQKMGREGHKDGKRMNREKRHLPFRK